MRIDTAMYVNTHRHEPRGFGHWLFEIGGTCIRFIGAYGDASRRARRWAIQSTGTRKGTVCLHP